jgi:hypothetical protein
MRDSSFAAGVARVPCDPTSPFTRRYAREILAAREAPDGAEPRESGMFDRYRRPPGLRLAKTTDFLSYQRLALARRRVLAREPLETLDAYQRMVAEVDGEAAVACAREAIEIYNEALVKEAEQLDPDSHFFGLYPQVTPSSWPRVSLMALERIGNPALLDLRSREESARERQRTRAAKALTTLLERGVSVEEILEGETGRRWMYRHCAGDPDLAGEAFSLAGNHE